MDARRDMLVAACLATGASLALWWMHPRIGVRDGDAVAYITGAMSFQARRGFVDLSGHALNHWPPGYSWWLSLFSQPLLASQVVNYAAFGLALAALFWNARSASWTVETALALSLVLGFGFLRGIATNAAPDIVVYAAFLLVLPLYLRGGRGTWVAVAVWAAMIPIKLIAVVFVPAGMLAAWWTGDRIATRQWGVALVGWGLVIAALCAFNLRTVGQIVPATHAPASMRSVADALGLMIFGLPRQGLAFWYGSVRSWTVMAPFVAIAGMGAWCYASLERATSASKLFALGLTLLGLSVALQFVRQYSGGWRLTAYGLFAMLLGMRARPHTGRRWLVYAAASLAFAVTNARTVNAMGVNDARYATLAAQVGPSVDAMPLATNSYHLLDVHQRIATTPVGSLSEVVGQRFLWIDLPSYDGTATVITAMDRPSAGWCEAAEVAGAVLFRRCAAASK